MFIVWLINRKKKIRIIFKMVVVIFIYEALPKLIKCDKEDKMKDIINKFKSEIEAKNINFSYKYEGDTFDEELTFNQLVNDSNITQIYISVYKTESGIKSYDIICPKCNENILINIKEYKINLFNCKNGHQMNNI